VVCISGMVEEDKISDLMAAGANEFLQKPFELDTLVDVMCRQLDVEPAHAR
jgi:FixJ family two-component response regulator